MVQMNTRVTSSFVDVITWRHSRQQLCRCQIVAEYDIRIRHKN